MYLNLNMYCTGQRIQPVFSMQMCRMRIGCAGPFCFNSDTCKNNKFNSFGYFN